MTNVNDSKNDLTMPQDPKNPQDTQPTDEPVNAKWEDLGLSKEMLEVIRQVGFPHPTPIQAQAIPPALEGHDLLASAQTGTGKTLGFITPLIERFAGRSGTFGLILSPTREIAQQTHAAIEIFGKPRGVRSIVLIGGTEMRLDSEALQTYPHIIVATPGRLCDHMERGNVWLDFIETVVLDEADRMLDMGFSSQLEQVMKTVPENAQKLCFSATILPQVDAIARKFMYEPIRISVGKSSNATPTVEQRFVYVREEAKFLQLLRLVEKEKGSIIVFTRSKDTASRLYLNLHSARIYDAAAIHSNLQQKHREQALADFKSGKVRVLIATDVAGRGIHVDNVAHVINFELPMEPEDYIHRIGRTGRASASGHATTFVSSRDLKSLKEIERLLGKGPIHVEGMPSEDERRNERPSGGGHRRPSGKPSGGSRPAGRSASPRSSGSSGTSKSSGPSGGKVTPHAPKKS